MRVLIQRTSGVKLYIDSALYSETKAGLLVLFGTKEGDNDQSLSKLADKIVNMRIFEDENGKMNLSAIDTNSEIMVVSQFTLYANTDKGRRPSFNLAQNPTDASKLYDQFISYMNQSGLKIAHGQFGASMDIHFNNLGPVTIIVDDV